MPDYPPLICGIDPGVGGGIAFVSTDLTNPLAIAYRMPETRKDMIDLVNEYHGKNGSIVARAYVERVRSSPQMGVVSSFTFGCNYERVVMVFICAGISLEEITPQRWQKALGCLTHGDKRVSKARAQNLYPTLKITNYIADALLIAEYGRRQIV